MFVFKTVLALMLKKIPFLSICQVGCYQQSDTLMKARNLDGCAANQLGRQQEQFGIASCLDL